MLVRLVAACLIASLTVLPAASAQRDGAHIMNSGSTNAPGYDLAVWSDGQTSLAPVARAGFVSASPRRMRISQALATQFLIDAKDAKRLRPAVSACMKSVSFGSSTTVEYHGYRSPDLSCPAAGPVARRLWTDAQKVLNESGAESTYGPRVRPIGRPVGLPRGEPRRTEPTARPTARPQ